MSDAEETTVQAQALVDWVRDFADQVRQNQQHLTDLDSAIGDADHGGNMVRGLTAAAEAVGEAESTATAASVLKTVGMALVSNVGGASGPLYGTFFIRLSTGIGDATLEDPLQAESMGAALQAGLDGVIARGKAEVGDKTMVDALVPALDAWRAAADEGVPAAATAAFAAAEIGRDSTIELVARKGRASYLGERSAGHMDPGAMSTYLMFGALKNAVTP